MKARSLVQKEIDERWWASVFRFVGPQVEASLKTTSERVGAISRIVQKQNESKSRKTENIDLYWFIRAN